MPHVHACSWHVQTCCHTFTTVKHKAGMQRCLDCHPGLAAHNEASPGYGSPSLIHGITDGICVDICVVV